MKRKHCAKCGRRFPADLFNNYFVDGETRRGCPLCAWRECNDLHGFGNEPLRGARARELFDAAVEHVKRTEQTLTDREREAYEIGLLEPASGASVRFRVGDRIINDIANSEALERLLKRAGG